VVRLGHEAMARGGGVAHGVRLHRALAAGRGGGAANGARPRARWHHGAAVGQGHGAQRRCRAVAARHTALHRLRGGCEGPRHYHGVGLQRHLLRHGSSGGSKELLPVFLYFLFDLLGGSRRDPPLKSIYRGGSCPHPSQ
jgi:hypothetical protein